MNKFSVSVISDYKRKGCINVRTGPVFQVETVYVCMYVKGLKRAMKNHQIWNSS